MNLGVCLIHQAPLIGYSPRKEEFLCKICVQRSSGGNPLIEMPLVQQAIQRVIQSLKKAVKNTREQINKEPVLLHYENCQWLHNHAVAKNLHADILKFQREWDGSTQNSILQGKVNTKDAKKLLIKLNFTNKNQIRAIIQQHIALVFKALATAVRQLRELLIKEDADKGQPYRDSQPFELINSQSVIIVDEEEDESQVYIPVNIPSANPVIEAANVAMKKIIELKANAKSKMKDIAVNLPESKQKQQKNSHKNQSHFEQLNPNRQNTLIREQKPTSRQQQAKRQEQSSPKHLMNKSLQLEVSIQIQKPVTSIPKELQKQLPLNHQLQKQSQKQYTEKIQSERTQKQQPQKQSQTYKQQQQLQQSYKQPLQQSHKQQSRRPSEQPSEQTYRQQQEQPQKPQTQKNSQYQPLVRSYKQQPQKQPQQQPFEKTYNPSSAQPHMRPMQQSQKQHTLKKSQQQLLKQQNIQPPQQPYRQQLDQPYKQQSQKHSQWKSSEQPYIQPQQQSYRPVSKQTPSQPLEQLYTQSSKQSYKKSSEQSHNQQSQRQSQWKPLTQPYNSSTEHLYKQPSNQLQRQPVQREQKQLASDLLVDAIKEPIVENTQANSILDDSSLIIREDEKQYQQQATSSISKIQQIQRFQKTEVKKIEEPYESKGFNRTRKQSGQQKLIQQTTKLKTASIIEQSKQASTIQLQKFSKRSLVEQPEPIEYTNTLSRQQQEYRKQSQLKLKQPLITHPTYEYTHLQRTKPQLIVPSETKVQKPQLKRPEQIVREAAPRQPPQLIGRQLVQQQNWEKPTKLIDVSKMEKQLQFKKQNQERAKRVQRARNIYETMTKLKHYCAGKEEKKGLQIIQNLPVDYQKHATLLKIKSKLLVDLNRQNEALGIYQHLVKILPTDNKVIFEKAVIQFNLGLYANSQRTICTSKDSSPEVWTLRGDLEFINQYDKAQDFYKKAHNLKPSSITYSRLAAIQFRKGNISNALTYIENARKLDGKCAQYINDQAFAEMRLDKLSDANRSMIVAYQYQPNQPVYLNNLAVIKFREQKLSHALEFMQRAHQTNNKNDIRMFLNYAIIYQQVKKPEKTLELFKKYQNIYGDKLVFKLRMYQVAIRTNNKKIIGQIYPHVSDLRNKNINNKEISLLLCKFIALLGEVKSHHNQSARLVLLNIIQTAKGNTSQLMEIDARNCLAYLLKNVNQYRDAIEQLKNMLPLNDPIILYNLAHCQCKCSYYNEALITLRKFNNMNSCPQNLMKKVVLMTLMIFMTLKKKPEAINYLRTLNTNINIQDKQFISDLQVRLEQKK